MSYLGNAPESVFTEMKYQDLTGGSGTSFTLNQAVSNPQEIEVFVNNVRQEPSAAYSVSGTTLTMTESVGASEDFYVIFQGMAQGSATHPATQSLEAASVTSNGIIKIPLDGSSSTNQISVGASNDLRIFHNGSASYVYDAGTGSLQLVTNNLEVRGADFARKMISATDQGTVELYHNNSKKIETTSAGVDVTGTMTSDGLTVDGGGSRQYINSGHLRLSDDYNLEWGGGTNLIQGSNSSNHILFKTNSNERVRIDSNGNAMIGTTSAFSPGGVNSLLSVAGNLTVTKNQAAHTNVDIFNNNGNSSAKGQLRVGYDAANCLEIFRVGNSADITLNATQNGSIIFQGAGGEMMRMSTAGLAIGGNGAANTLDDYEEGTFTPTITTASSYSQQLGKYTKIGNLVNVQVTMYFVQSGTSMGAIGGLPFALANGNYLSIFLKEWYSFGTAHMTFVQSGATATAGIRDVANNSLTASNGSTYGWSFSFTYQTS